MSFEEKMTWVSAVVGTLVPAVYFYNVMGEVADTPVAEIGYQRMLVVAIGVTIVLTIAGSIGTAIATAIGTAVKAEVTGEESPGDIDRKDERDVRIGRKGDLIGMYVSSGGMVGVLALAMLEVEHFWIANALYLAFVIGTLVTNAVKVAAYRRGF